MKLGKFQSRKRQNKISLKIGIWKIQHQIGSKSDWTRIVIYNGCNRYCVASQPSLDLSSFNWNWRLGFDRGHLRLEITRIEKFTIISLNHSKILLFYSQYSTHYRIVKFTINYSK
jgi:hypothetical protein